MEHLNKGDKKKDKGKKKAANSKEIQEDSDDEEEDGIHFHTYYFAAHLSFVYIYYCTDNFHGLLDDALWSMFTGNVSVHKLSPSPAKDTVRLAISALATKEKAEHEKAKQVVEAKELVMKEIMSTSIKPLGSLVVPSK
jgi:hypothetical protein